jgi:hypothetical protein
MASNSFDEHVRSGRLSEPIQNTYVMGTPGKHHHWYVGEFSRAVDRSEELPAIHPGHLEIQEHECRPRMSL